MAVDATYKKFFPNICDVQNKKTSEATSTYNCIAWAFEESHRIWWPCKRGYWPTSFDSLTVAEAFDKWFAEDGWEETKDATVEPDVKKIALYMLNGDPTHAARQLSTGLWTSKLGWDPSFGIDLSHQLADLDGPSYGQFTKIYKKSTAPSSNDSEQHS